MIFQPGDRYSLDLSRVHSFQNNILRRWPSWTIWENFYRGSTSQLDTVSPVNILSVSCRLCCLSQLTSKNMKFSDWFNVVFVSESLKTFQEIRFETITVNRGITRKVRYCKNVIRRNEKSTETYYNSLFFVLVLRCAKMFEGRLREIIPAEPPYRSEDQHCKQRCQVHRQQDLCSQW